MNRTLVRHAAVTLVSVLSWPFSVAVQGAAVTWDAGGVADKNWSNFNNFSDDNTPAGDGVTFNNTGSDPTTGNVTNIVDSSVSISGLNYSNTGATNTHTTQINTNQILTVIAPGTNFSVGSAGVTKVNFTGGGKLVVTDLQQIIGNVAGGTTIVDMSQLDTYSTIGGSFYSGTGFGTTHTVTMAAINFWQVGQFRIHSAFANNNSFKLGQTNTIRVATDDFQLGTGGGSTGNTIGFMAGLSGTPTLTIRNYFNNGTGRTPGGMYIGQQSSNGSSGTSMVMDLTATGGTDGSIDARLTSLVIGDKTNANDDAGGGTGTLAYDQGTVDTLTATLGRIVNASLTAAAVTNGTLTVGGSGTFIADTIKFGDNASSGPSAANGTLNISGGTIQATTMQPGAGNGTTRTINFNSGKIQNKATTNLTIASGLTINVLTAGTHTFEADANQSITVNSAIGGGGAGSVTKAGNGTLTLNATNSYTAPTLVSAGKLIVDGSIATSSGVSVSSGATLGGHGAVSAISGAGLVSPGNSAGVLTGTSVDASTGLDFFFEFGALGSPTYGTAAASVNDVLHLTGATPFTSNLGSGSVVDVVFNLVNLSKFDLLRGAFYTDTASDFVSSIGGATYNFYVLGNGSGTHNVNGTNYYTLAEYNNALHVHIQTVAESANFGGGPISGQVTQFGLVPEPSSVVLLGMGATLFAVRRRRHRG